MILALSILLGVSLLLNGFVFWICHSLIQEKDVLSFREREQILQRIQSPISAVAVHAQQQMDENETGNYTLPYDDDEAMSEFLEAGEQNGN